MRTRYLFALLVLIFLCSCTQQRTAKNTENFEGRQIILSPEWNTIWKGQDTLLTGFTEVPIKLIVWYDATACAACELSNMNGWRHVIAYADSLSQWFRIIYLFSPQEKDFSSVRRTLRARKFDYPLFLDRNTTFTKQNPNLPQDPKLHTFLLDKNNKVVFLGNPLHNSSFWAFYKMTIQRMIDNDGILPER